METLFQYALILLLVTFIGWLTRTIIIGIKLAKTNPIRLKLGDLVLYNNKYCRVTSTTDNKYDLLCLDRYNTKILNVNRESIKRRVRK